MSVHVHDDNCTFTSGAICGGGPGRVYVACSRRPGAKKWNVISKHRTYKAALKAMTAEFSKGVCKRADVLMCDEWYDPVQVCELVRR